MWKYIRYSWIIIGSFLGLVSQARTVNPLQYGLLDATNGVERYEVLLRCHNDAILKGYSISYRGIDTIRLEIPRTFISIPLTDNVNFHGATIIVENKHKDCSLFELNTVLSSIEISGSDIDRGDYKNHDALRFGRYLLVIEDSEPWTIRKSGTELIRKDVIVIKNGIALNKPIKGYGLPTSKPIAKYRRIDRKRKSIKNLNFVRTASSTHKTFCLKIDNQYNVDLSNISITTPKDATLYGDAAIHFDNCANVTLNDIHINGTYSQKDKFGYGIGMVNVYGLTVNRLFARCNWGVFGTQSVNNTVLKDCDINRFDIHCYGRDIKAVNCKFSKLYNQVSSVYGIISFKNCEFENFIPLLIESSYNAYTPFDLEFLDCKFYLDDKYNYIMTLFGVPQPYNERPELKRKCLPNITMKDCIVFLPDTTKDWVLVKTGGLYYQDSFDYITDIAIINLQTYCKGSVNFKLFSEEVKTTEKINVRIQ